MYCSVEWLNSELAKCPDKRSRRNMTITFLTMASDFLSSECYEICLKLKKEAEEDNDVDMLAYILLYISFAKKVTGELKEAETTFNKVLGMIPEISGGFSSMIVYQMIAFEFWSSGKRDIAFDYAFKSLRHGADASEGRGWAYFQLGVFYFDMKDYDSSMKYFTLSSDEANEFDLNYQLARTYSGIAGVHIARGELEQALHFSEQALNGYREVGHETAISRALNDLGVISMRREEFAKSEKYLKEALGIRERLNYAPGIITTRMELGRLMKLLGKENEEEVFLTSALEMSETTQAKQKAVACHLLLAEHFKKKKDPWKALAHVEKYNSVKAEIAGEETSNRIKHLQEKFATEKSEQEAEIHRLKNVELAELNAQIEEKNKSILDSIQYAKRIQDSLLPSEKLIGRTLDRLQKN